VTKLHAGFLILAVAVCVLVLPGCAAAGSSGGIGTPPQICDSSDDPCVAATVPPCATGQIAIGTLDGYTITNGVEEANFFPNNYQNCVAYPFTTQMSPTPFDLAFAPPNGGTALMYWEFSPENGQDIQGYPGVAIRVPASVIVAGRTFYVAGDYYGSFGPWVPAAMGPLTLSGGILHWAQTGNDIFDIEPGYNFEFALYYVGA
jgi:hypothetical protein